MKTPYIIAAIIAMCLIGCPGPDNSQRPLPNIPIVSEESRTPAPVAPSTSADNGLSSPPTALVSPVVSNTEMHSLDGCLTLDQHEVASAQAGPVREIIHFDYKASGSFTLRTVECALITNNVQRQGKVLLEVDGTIVRELDLSTLNNHSGGTDRLTLVVVASDLNVLLVNGTHRIRLLVNSDHGTSDVIQGEVRNIVTNKTHHNVVFKWRSVLCG